MKVWDIAQEACLATCREHSHGVSTFVHSPAFSLFASGGQERDVMVWSASGK